MKSLMLWMAALVWCLGSLSEELARKACIVEETPVLNEGSSILGIWNPGFESFLFFVHSIGDEVILKETSLPGEDWVWMPGTIGNKVRDTFHTNNSILVVKEDRFWFGLISEEDDGDSTILATVAGTCHDLPIE